MFELSAFKRERAYPIVLNGSFSERPLLLSFPSGDTYISLLINVSRPTNISNERLCMGEA